MNFNNDQTTRSGALHTRPSDRIVPSLASEHPTFDWLGSLAWVWPDCQRTLNNKKRKERRWPLRQGGLPLEMYVYTRYVANSALDSSLIPSFVFFLLVTTTQDDPEDEHEFFHHRLEDGGRKIRMHMQKRLFYYLGSLPHCSHFYPGRDQKWWMHVWTASMDKAWWSACMYVCRVYH
jgi:hypothetical protein